MDRAVFDLFNAYYAALHDMTDPRRNLDDRLRGNYGRFSTMALKLALILAIMDWTDEGMHNTPRITTVHWARGQMLAEEYRASVHRLLDELSIGVDVNNEEKVLDFITRHGERPPSARDILRGAGVKSRKEIDATLAALVEDGVIEVVERKGTGADRPSKGYRQTLIISS